MAIWLGSSIKKGSTAEYWEIEEKSASVKNSPSARHPHSRQTHMYTNESNEKNERDRALCTLNGFLYSNPLEKKKKKKKKKKMSFQPWKPVSINPFFVWMCVCDVVDWDVRVRTNQAKPVIELREKKK